jgi:hypothetical protein
MNQFAVLLGKLQAEQPQKRDLRMQIFVSVLSRSYYLPHYRGIVARGENRGRQLGEFSLRKVRRKVREGTFRQQKGPLARALLVELILIYW